MKKEKISDVIGMIDEKYIEEATAYPAASNDNISKTIQCRRARRVRWGVLAACLALIILTSSAAVAFAAEAKEYNAAVAFFEENGLSSNGLTRAEIKEVYRDITMQNFTYGKTADVIKHSVLGYEISQDEPTPEELAQTWNNNYQFNKTSKEGIHFRRDVLYKHNEYTGSEMFDKCVLECYKDGTLIWSAEFRDFFVSGTSLTQSGVAVWGQDHDLTAHAWLAHVDDDGNVLWKKSLDHGFNREYIAAVIDNGDGTWAVVSRSESSYLCLSQFDINGNEHSFKATEVGNLGVGTAVKLGDGYLVQLGNVLGSIRHASAVIKLDRDGNLVDRFTYEGEDCDYYITDMAEFGGKIYLSAYAVPKQTDVGGRDEIADILSYLWENHRDDYFNVPDEELTPLVRDNYTAVLLVCDTESGTPTTFYSVTGSLGGKLTVSDGKLTWDVETILTTFFSPATSSFSIGGTCEVFRYTFDISERLLDQKDTGETVQYRR